MNYKALFDTIVNDIRDSLQSDDFLCKYKENRRFCRKRKLSMFQTIMYLLYSNRSGMATNIGNIRDDLWSLDFPNVSRQAVSKARQHILPDLFGELFKITVNNYYSAVNDYHLWNGYHLFAIDGSQIHMTKSLSVLEEFGENSDPRYDRRHYMGLASCLYDISQDIVLDASLAHCLTGERALAKQHLDKLREFQFSEVPLILFDRGYYSHEMFNYLVDSGYKCLMRIKQHYTSLTSADADDALIDLDKIHGKIRVIKVALSTNELEYLVTNVMDSDLTPEIFKDLYHERWKIESKYYELKEQWSLETFNGATSRAVRQEFFITLMKSNLCSIVKQGVDESLQESNSKKKEKKIPKYHGCRAFIIGRLSRLLPKYILRERVRTTSEQLFKDAKRILSQIRPGRHAKRKKPTNHKVNCRNRKTTT